MTLTLFVIKNINLSMSQNHCIKILKKVIFNLPIQLLAGSWTLPIRLTPHWDTTETRTIWAIVPVQLIQLNCRIY